MWAPPLRDCGLPWRCQVTDRYQIVSSTCADAGLRAVLSVSGSSSTSTLTTSAKPPRQKLRTTCGRQEEVR